MLRFLVRLSRPRFALYEFGTFWIGVLAGVSVFSELKNPLLWIFAFYFLFPANLLIYGINDIYDYETDRLNMKKNGYEDLLLPEKHREVWKWIILTNAPFVLCVPWMSQNTVLALLVFWFCAIFYSAPPIRAKARPFFDSVFSAGHYMATGVFGYLLISTFSAPDWQIVLAGLCWCFAMHAYSAIPDIRSDTDAGLQTVATRLGAEQTLLLCIFLYGVAVVLSFSALGLASVFFGLGYILLMILSSSRSQEELLGLYTFFPWMNAIVGAMITIWILRGIAL